MAKHQLKQLSPKHYRMLEMTLQGMGRAEIAREMDVTPQCVSLVVNSPVFQQQLSRRRERRERAEDQGSGIAAARAREVLDNAAEQAAEKHVALLGSEDDAIAQRSASEILDRTGVTRQAQRKDNEHAGVLIDAQQLNVILLALEEDEDEALEGAVASAND